jgi:hypothetical protein
MVEPSMPRQPYHAVAEYGSPTNVIDVVTDAARRAAVEALRSMPRVDVVGLVGTERRIPGSLDQILASHALLHAAEGQLFERAVIEAANDAGLSVHIVEPRSIEISESVDALRRSVGAPWQKDHKWATTAALAALASV